MLTRRFQGVDLGRLLGIGKVYGFKIQGFGVLKGCLFMERLEVLGSFRGVFWFCLKGLIRLKSVQGLGFRGVGAG